jgi:hypothetical protein
MTVSGDHAARPDDPQASLRAELLGQIAAAQFDLEAAIADLTRDGAPAAVLADSRSQFGALIAMRRQMGSASPSALAEMRNEVAALVASGQSAAQQARSAAASNADMAELSSRAAEARARVDETMRGMKDFDADLRFADQRDQAEYRRREAERLAYIAAEQAKGAPESHLNASGAAIGQMADAAAHGAADNPEFTKRWDALMKSTRKLREQVIRDGGDVSKFDSDVRADLRRILKSKGKSDAEIDALLAAHHDPLDAMQAIVAEQKVALADREIDDFTMKAREHKDGAALAATETKLAATALPIEQPGPLADAMSVLKAAGVAPSTHDAEAPPTHGVTAQVAAVVASTRAV